MNDRIVIDPKTCHGKPIIRGTRTPVTVGTERHAHDRVQMPAQRPEFGSRAGVPDLDRLVVTGGRDPAPIRAERDTGDLVPMASPDTSRVSALTE